MNDIRFLTVDDLYHIKTLFSVDRTGVGVEFTDQDVNNLIDRLTQKMEAGTVHIPVVFNSFGKPLCMYIGFELPKIGGWWSGLTKVLEPKNHFSQQAPLLAVAYNALIQRMENKGYYKFWGAAPEIHHNIRNKIMRKHSFMLDRYNWFDEDVILQGEKSKVEAFNMHRFNRNWSNIVVRLFVLKQSERIKILKKNSCIDYDGTLIDLVK